MKFLIDLSPNRLSEKIDSPLVMGQLLTPLTGYADAGGVYAIDNGAFSGFPADRFRRLLERQEGRKADCLFVTCPDIVGAGQRSIELFKRRTRWIPSGWRVALVAQDGMEDLEIPWDEMNAIFIGGGDPWKDSKASQDIVKTAVTLGVGCMWAGSTLRDGLSYSTNSGPTPAMDLESQCMTTCWRKSNDETSLARRCSMGAKLV